jgi:hypothetical protein
MTIAGFAAVGLETSSGLAVPKGSVEEALFIVAFVVAGFVLLYFAGRLAGRTPAEAEPVDYTSL